MTQTTYALVDDGEYRWTAEVTSLARALHAVGYRTAEVRGYLIAEAPEDINSAELNADLYAELCSRVTPEEVFEPGEEASGDETETMNMDEANVGAYAWVLSRGLYYALAACEVADDDNDREDGN
jgi:hypothetical protein